MTTNSRPAIDIPQWTIDALAGALERALPGGYCVTDSDGLFVAVSPGYCRLLALDEGALVGRPVTAVLPPAAREAGLRVYRGRLAAGGAATPEEWTLQAGDGRLIAVEWTSALFEALDGTALLLSVIGDMSARKAAEAAASAGRAELARLNRHKDELIEIIGHDLRGLLNPVGAFADLVALERGRLDPGELIAQAESLREAAVQGEALLANLLDWARSEDAAAVPVAIDLQAFIAAAIRPHEAAARRKRVLLLAEPAVGSVRADRLMLETVLRNLIANALKFTPPGGRVTVSADHEAETVVLAVRDSGVGIDPALADRLMSGDGTVSPQRGTHGESGAGFGFRLVRRLLVRLGGRLEIDGRSGQGTVVRVVLPAPVLG
ncbi:MAG: sensor histidine kinase [Ferrovibrionaceae bacterium]